ncbi:carboxypeptidase regulatory-like domain-containing protein [Luteimonas suaedae]|uniref:carboxypeptidase regulatory-like domain-containing protein n=1 Tax=Luteimonas suaedae TaxID=2605430 RepID=UPI0011ED3744|nr:carboxypeptidase regulatory-like domain-containing protein [Luteimonas suaedae]
MSPQSLLVGLLILAVALGWTRLLGWQWRAPAGARSRTSRLVLLLALQPLCALLLYRTLVPPTLPTRAGDMTVLTAGATRAQLDASVQGEVLVALPEAPRLRDAVRVPDLATALRRHPGTARVHVIGAGLEARDRDALGEVALTFEPSPLPAGLVALWAPERIAAGDAFRVAGRVHDVDGGSVELLDPAGRRVDVAALAEDGGFTVVGSARTPGTVRFALRVRNGDRGTVEEVAVPLWIAPEPPPRVLLLAGAPNPEFKYLRRWAADAGMALQVQVAVGGGVTLGDAPVAMNAESLREFDLVVLDERAWATLGETRRAALATAVRDGLGVLLRITAPLPESTRRQLQAFGFEVSAGAATTAVAMPPAIEDETMLLARLGAGTADAPVDAALASEAPPDLSRRDLRIAAADAATGVASATDWLHWRAEGRGRIALATLVDSYRLVLSGRDDLHAELWSAAFAAATRPHGTAEPAFAADIRADERTAICGVDAQVRVQAPDGSSTRLLPDPAAGGCAGYWPRLPGWHALLQDDEARPFHVRARDAAPGLRASTLREATLRHVGAAPQRSDADVRPGLPRRGASWPWFLGWLAAAAMLWWLERSRFGRAGRRQATDPLATAAG